MMKKIFGNLNDGTPMDTTLTVIGIGFVVLVAIFGLSNIGRGIAYLYGYQASLIYGFIIIGLIVSLTIYAIANVLRHLHK